MGRQGRDAVVDERGEDAPGDFLGLTSPPSSSLSSSLPSLSLSLLSRASSASRSAMRSSRVSTPSSSASPERFGAASLSSSSLLLDAGVLSSTRSAAPALLASLLLLSSLLLSSLLLLLLLLGRAVGGGGGAFLSFLRFFASLEASLSLFLPIVNASRGQYWRVAVGGCCSAAKPMLRSDCRAREMNCDGIAQHSYTVSRPPASVSPTPRARLSVGWLVSYSR